MQPTEPPGFAHTLADALASAPEVELAYLFGSQTSGRARRESDIDVAVLVSKRAAAEVRATLAHLLDRLGKVVPSHRPDLVLLNGAPSLLRHRVLATGRLLFARDPVGRVRFTARAIQDYQDMQVRREFFYRNRVERLKEEGSYGGSGDLLAEARRVARLFGEARHPQRDDG